MDEQIEVGDHVYHGEGGKVHWLVVRLFETPSGFEFAKIKSGMTGRVRIVQRRLLRLHSKGKT